MQRNGSLIYVCFLCFLCFSLLTIISTRVKYDRKNKKRNEARRNDEGLTQKQAELKELNSKVVELKEQGLSLRKIAEELNITLGKVQRVLKK